ncbi:hypothetical protein EW145_g8063, partial [Phellinidium pouzarii]
ARLALCRAHFLHGALWARAAIVLDFGPGGVPGTVLFMQQSVSMPMGHWMRKTGQVGKPIERSFKCSDGQEYKWVHQASAEAEWVCTTTSSDYVVAQYKLRSPEEPTYASSSGNMFTVYESYGHVTTGASVVVLVCAVARFADRRAVSPSLQP